MSDDFQQLKRDVAALRAQLSRVEGMARAQVPTSFAGAPAATTLVVTQASHGFAVKDPVRYNGTSWVKSTADTAANAIVAGIVTTVINANTVIVTTGGYAAGLSGLTAGSVYYLDTTGGLTATAPAIAVPVLMADSTTSGVIIAGSGGGVPNPLVLGSVSADGKLQIFGDVANAVVVEIDGSLVTASSKELTIREIDVCDAGVAKKMLVLGSATY